MNRGYAFTDQRPIGFPELSNKNLIKIKNLIEEKNFDESISALEKFSSDSAIDILWKYHFVGLSYIGKKDFEKSLDAFKSCYSTTKSKPNPSSDEFRVAGLCLKKLGWIYRSKKDYLTAYAYHNIRLTYMREHGSNFEVHDSLISLDVDAYFLGDMALSEKYLSESIPYAEKVDNKKGKYMALGTSYNNLGGTLYGLKKFEESESSIKLALENWTKYEELAGFSEFKVVWAHWGVGDVYENWAKYLKEAGKDFSKQKTLALEAYNQSLRLAKDQEMPEKDQRYITERIDAVDKM